MAQSMAATVRRLQRMTVSELKKKYVEVFGSPPRCDNRTHLWRRIAWQIQADAEGGLSEKARDRIAELNRDMDIHNLFAKRAPRHVAGPSASGPRRDPRLPAPGTVITRRYRGQKVAVKVLEYGFEYDGRPYRSLSAVAEAVTGSHWNGFLFFALDAKGKGG